MLSKWDEVCTPSNHGHSLTAETGSFCTGFTRFISLSAKMKNTTTTVNLKTALGVTVNFGEIEWEDDFCSGGNLVQM